MTCNCIDRHFPTHSTSLIININHRNLRTNHSPTFNLSINDEIHTSLASHVILTASTLKPLRPLALVITTVEAAGESVSILNLMLEDLTDYRIFQKTSIPAPTNTKLTTQLTATLKTIDVFESPAILVVSSGL